MIIFLTILSPSLHTSVLLIDRIPDFVTVQSNSGASHPNERRELKEF